MAQLTTTPPQDTKPTDFLSRPLIASIGLDWEKAIYLTFIVIAILTRFFDLGSRVMSHDESLHTQFSYQYYNGDGYSHTPLMHGPFLFHATSIAYWLFGDSDFSARIPVAILGVILIIMPYFLRDWLGKRGALVTSFIFLISPYLLYYSRYIRHDIYVIIWALIVFTAIVYYTRERKNKYLWWFTIGLVLMFATKEVAFIYVAIFGSFLVLRLLVRLAGSDWIRGVLPALRMPFLLVLLGIVMVAAGYGAHVLSTTESAAIVTEATSEGFAADPTQDLAAPDGQSTGTTLTQWIELVGIGVFSLGLFLVARALRPRIDEYAEFDLIILFTTLLLPLASPLLARIAGYNPQDTTINTCILEGQEAMSGMGLFLARATNATCISSFLDSGLVVSTIFLVISLVVAIAVGLWWDKRRWIVAAIIFHGIFLVLYTSVFTNAGGWRTGMVGSLGYWLEQQGVQRGSQPWYYYLFVTPFYEFLPIIFALAGTYLWTKQQRINKIVWYWVLLGLAALVTYSLANWLFNRNSLDPSGSSFVPGLMAAAAVLGLGALYWFVLRRKQIARSYDLEDNRLWRLFDPQQMVTFVPALIWWMVLTWLAYSIAGEKMPWLSTHFVIPMAMLSGWYINERLELVDMSRLFSRDGLLALLVTGLLIVVALVALAPLLLGQVTLGDQTLQNLTGTGRFLGGLLLAGGVGYGCWWLLSRFTTQVRSVIVTLAVFGVLSLLTIRSSLTASFVNGDYTNEFLVYAHGAPATKDVVLRQLDDLSTRLEGDNSISVAYDSDVSWPFTWYLRDYPNRVFFGENPSQSLNDSPVVIVGSRNWDKVDPFLANNYSSQEYTFLWWPMEDYRRFSWDAIFGNPDDAVRRGLGNPDVREALWDIFFYRDYTKYGEVFGGTFTAGEWPLRHNLRLYVRNDVAGNLWDFGAGTTTVAALGDPYEANFLTPPTVTVINPSGIADSALGSVTTPRNVAVGPDGLIYVADSGNHRVQVFDANGAALNAWGSFGPEPGQFNEPWGLAVDDSFVYVADTWNHRVQKFTLDGELVGVFGTSGSPTPEDPSGALGQFFGPRDIAILADGRLIVSDTGNHRLQVLDKDGNFSQVVGGFGGLPGQFNEPVGVAVNVDGSVYVADTWNGRVQRLSPDLQYLSEFRVEAWFGQSINNKPYLSADSEGRIYLTDPEGYQVLVFSPSGGYLNRFGTFGGDAASFGLPNGIALDGDDRILVADSGNNRVLVFAPIYGTLSGTIDDGLPDDGQ